MSPPSLDEAILGIRELRGLPLPARRILSKHCETLNLRGGEVLWFSERTADQPRRDHQLAIVLGGMIEIVRAGRLLDVMSRHEGFGFSPIISGHPGHSAEARAPFGVATSVLLVDTKPFTSARALGSVALERAMLRLLVRCASDITRRHNELQELPDYDRLAYLLLRLSEDGTNLILHRQPELAALTHVSPAQISRLLKQLSDDGFVERDEEVKKRRVEGTSHTGESRGIRGLRLRDSTLLRAQLRRRSIERATRPVSRSAPRPLAALEDVGTVLRSRPARHGRKAR